MHLSKPDWVQHENDRGAKASIFSLSLHPDGTRLATGALEPRVKIWNTRPMLDPAAEADPSVPRLLATLSAHNGNVLCVAWSHGSGRYLATGSDDCIVLIWELDASPAFGNLGGGAANVENWKVVKRLAGHGSDVTDLAWAPENAYLATCALDSTVCVWDGRTFEMLRKLTLHDGFVKGLTWDPAGKYLASESDDKSLRIWRTSDWQLEAHITAPLADSSNVTMYRRPSWSPDGAVVVVANAAERLVPLSAVIERETWTSEISLMGHAAPIEVVKFNPVLFRVPDDKAGGLPTAVVAVGSQDRSVSVWTTNNPRVLEVSDATFEHNVTDLDWTPDGLTLMASSYDGTVAVMTFEEHELGQPVSTDETLALLAKHGYQRKAAVPAEGPEQLRLEEAYAVASRTANAQRLARLMGTESPLPAGTPVVNPAAAPIPVAAASPAPVSTSAPPATPLAQRVTITKDGKKRIQPVFLRGMAGEVPPPPPPVLPTPAPLATSTGTPAFSSQPAAAVDLDGPVAAVPLAARAMGNGPGSTVPTSRSVVNSQVYAHSQIRLAVPRIQAHVQRPPNRRTTDRIDAYNEPRGLQPARLVLTRENRPLWTAYLPAPVLALAGNERFALAACADGALHFFSAAGRRIFPPFVLEAPASFVDCNGRYALCLTSVGQLYVWDVIGTTAVVTGISVGPLLDLATAPAQADRPTTTVTSAHLRPQGTAVLTTSTGQAYLYHQDLRTWLRVVDRWYAGADLALARAPATLGHNTPSGLLAGLQKATARQAVDMGPADEDRPAYADPVRLTQLCRRLDDTQRRAVTMDHLEQQIAASRVLGSPSEYRYWLNVYAKRLADENSQERVRELCNELLGPLYLPTPPGKAHPVEWEPTVLVSNNTAPT
ncbi:HIR complex subunit [Tieghemiomyces parasiticus]|uniref:Protein HIR n=1 Tax=Tieghemiomyces parasiticus TaxID=78921 RepID=A0A9W8E331_9FUNG|nr:HIR complex subunit [Tieghemiomyces parasiticus]